MEIYPNPITGNTFSTRLNFVPADKDELAIYDSQGVCVFRSPLGNNPETIFQLAPSFGKGLYFLFITTGSGVLRTRLAAQ